MPSLLPLAPPFEADAARRGAAARAPIRTGAWSAHTGGLGGDLVQGNLVILPQALAGDFERYCELNSQACPLLAVGAPGDASLPGLGAGIDVRTDLPRYRLWRGGELVEEPTDIRALWRDDLVAFVIGCSFSFEWALREAGVALRHVEQGRNVAMYRSSTATVAAGPFHGPLVVSMRPLLAADAIRAVQITARFPAVHGAPVHLGDPALIGIDDLAVPDYGEVPDIRAGELPVFWACGVTPQAAIAAARLDFCITHAPGAMLITDIRNAQLAAA